MLSGFAGLRASTANLGSLVLRRGKRTARLAPGANRVINMLSVLSARKKQPRRLKLCREDIVRHEVVAAAWRIHLRDERAAREQRLRTQYERIREACDELERLDPALFAAANASPAGARIPLELRVPTDTPPTTPWDFDWAPKTSK